MKRKNAWPTAARNAAAEGAAACVNAPAGAFRSDTTASAARQHHQARGRGDLHAVPGADAAPAHGPGDAQERGGAAPDGDAEGAREQDAHDARLDAGERDHEQQVGQRQAQADAPPEGAREERGQAGAARHHVGEAARTCAPAPGRAGPRSRPPPPPTVRRASAGSARGPRAQTDAIAVPQPAASSATGPGRSWSAASQRTQLGRDVVEPDEVRLGSRNGQLAEEVRLVRDRGAGAAPPRACAGRTRPRASAGRPRARTPAAARRRSAPRRPHRCRSRAARSSGSIRPAARPAPAARGRRRGTRRARRRGPPAACLGRHRPSHVAKPCRAAIAVTRSASSTGTS